jgi:hypothetical protein
MHHSVLLLVTLLVRRNMMMVHGGHGQRREAKWRHRHHERIFWHVLQAGSLCCMRLPLLHVRLRLRLGEPLT